MRNHLFHSAWVTGCGEDEIQLFQLAFFGLYEEGIDYGNEGGVEDGLDDVCLPFNVGKQEMGSSRRQ